MTKSLLLLSSAALLFSCNSKPEQEEFTLTGTLKNIPDSTLVVMSKGNTDLDSALVIDEEFRFTGKVEQPFSVYLMLPETGDYTTLWLENSNIELSAEKGKFEDRVISGSQTQKEDDVLEAGLRSFRQTRDSTIAVNAEKSLSDDEQDSIYAFFDNLRQKELQATRDFVRENPNSIVSVYVLDFYKTTWGKKATEELYADIPAERRESTEGKMIAHFLEINKDPKIGEPYADFEMPNAEGETVRLSEIKGKYTLLYFWAAHCSPSKKENPNLVQNYETFKDRGFEIVGVSIDENRDAFSGSIEEHELPWNNLMSPAGPNNDAALIYGISGTPDNFLIDEEGNIIARNIRGGELTEKLEELLGKKALAAVKNGKS